MGNCGLNFAEEYIVVVVVVVVVGGGDTYGGGDSLYNPSPLVVVPSSSGSSTTTTTTSTRTTDYRYHPYQRTQDVNRNKWSFQHLIIPKVQGSAHWEMLYVMPMALR